MTNGEQNLNGRLESKIEVEWYSGEQAYTCPKRIKVNGVWEQVFYYEKTIQEDKITRKRAVIFYCHIGDNRIIEIKVNAP